jgi:hypothetical protein
MFDKRYVMGGDAANYSCGLNHHHHHHQPFLTPKIYRELF